MGYCDHSFGRTLAWDSRLTCGCVFASCRYWRYWRSWTSAIHRTDGWIIAVLWLSKAPFPAASALVRAQLSHRADLLAAPATENWTWTPMTRHDQGLQHPLHLEFDRRRRRRHSSSSLAEEDEVTCRQKSVKSNTFMRMKVSVLLWFQKAKRCLRVVLHLRQNRSFLLMQQQFGCYNTTALVSICCTSYGIFCLFAVQAHSRKNTTNQIIHYSNCLAVVLFTCAVILLRLPRRHSLLRTCKSIFITTLLLASCQMCLCVFYSPA